MADEQTTQGSDSPLEENGLKALQAERERAKTAEKRVHELEKTLETSKSEYDAKIAALQTQVDEGATALTQVTRERDRANVARSLGMPDDLVDYIRGENLEDMNESAKTLMAHVAQPATSTTPVPDPLQGARGEAGKGDSTAEQFATFIQEKFNQ